MHTYFSSPDVNYVVDVSQTPLLVLDAKVVQKQLEHFQQLLPDITPFYSVKTNPHPFILDCLKERGAHFDVATIGEIELVLARGVPPEHLLYSHPTKTKAEIKKALELQVAIFTLDSLDELQRLAELAPGAHYFVRTATNQNSSLYDYKRKFGASLAETRQILDYARDNTIAIAGLSFMVGSQSMDAGPWKAALESIHELISDYYSSLPTLRTVNIGSGFPLQYDFEDVIPDLTEIATSINTLKKQFPEDVRFIAEPGRYIVGPAGVFKTRVDRRLKRGDHDWLYVDMNAYSGLIEIIESGGKFRYPITSATTGTPTAFRVAGKTLDPDDILRQDASLSSDIKEGDILTVHDAGAYSASFFTDYHNLPKPGVLLTDSTYAENVSLAAGTMGITGIKASKAFSEGEVIFQISGCFTNERTRTSFQVAADKHIEPTLFGAYLNHSCNPNAGVQTNKFGHYDVIARQPINEGEEITADYAMFEYETGPMGLVDCLCGSPKCRKKITGYKDLPETLKKEYANFTAHYLAETSPVTTPAYASQQASA